QTLSQFQENRLWTLLDAYYTQSDHAHFDVLQRYRNNAKGASALKPELALLCTRGIGAIGGLLKMAAARYALVDPTLWKRLAEYYQLAESQGLANESVVVYPGCNQSPSEAFAVLLLWYGCSAGSLNPVQGHITERLFAALSKGVQVFNTYNGTALFVFDMAQPTPPMRATAEGNIHPALRYIVADNMRQMLDSMIKTLDKGILPGDVNFYGAKFETELVMDIAGRLLQSLTLPPPTRRTPRRKIKVNLKVANGFLKMLEQSDVGLNFGAEESEIWEVEDISATGFRSVVQSSRVDGIKIGSLVGSKPESVTHWGAGVVRRLSRDRDGTLHIGVEVLSPRVVGVPLQDRAVRGPEGGQLGLYLNRPADTSGEAWLLMKQDTYTPQRSLNMELEDKAYLLLPLALVERGDDYDLARYRMMEQDAASEA
ncbi:MAG: hypothetical protein PHY50_05350, partial [Sideroxydans sp.]|nr:hypothetical protein [Sideroxydans sp.]